MTQELPYESEQDENEIIIEADDIDQVIEDDQNDQFAEMDDTEMPEDLEIQEVEGDQQGGEITFTDDSIQGFFGHNDAVYSIDMHPVNENIVLSGGGDDKAYLWDITNGEALLECTGHTDSVVACKFSTAGDYFATGGLDGIVNVWNYESRSLAVTCEGPSEITFLNWHSKGNVLLGGSNDGTSWMWNVPSGNCMNVFYGHTGPVTSGCFTPDGKTVVSVSDDMTLCVFDPKTGELKYRFGGGASKFHEAAIINVAVRKDSLLAVTASEDSTCKLVHLANHKVLGSFGNHTDGVETVDFSSTLDWCASGGLDGKINIWDIATLQCRQTFQHDDGVVSLKWSSSGLLLNSISIDGSCRIWDARSGSCVKSFTGHENTLLDFAVSKDNRFLATASDDTNCLVFRYDF